jgi:hypothetical protein
MALKYLMMNIVCAAIQAGPYGFHRQIKRQSCWWADNLHDASVLQR